MIPASTPFEQFAAIMVSLVADLELRSCREALAQCHLEILEGVAQNFGRRADSAGVAWPERKPGSGKHPLLRLSYDLYQAAATHGGAGQVERLDARQSNLGVSLDVIPYARAQNLGHTYVVGTRSWVLPPREYFYVLDATLGRCDELIAKYALATIF